MSKQAVEITLDQAILDALADGVDVRFCARGTEIEYELVRKVMRGGEAHTASIRRSVSIAMMEHARLPVLAREVGRAHSELLRMV